MKLNPNTVVSVVAGVLLAGLILRYGGKLPVIMDASRGFDGERK